MGAAPGGIGEAGEGPRGEEAERVVDGEAALVDDDVFKVRPGGEEDAVAGEEWEQPEDGGDGCEREDETSEPALHGSSLREAAAD
jgi:hypothetical protein